MQTPQTTTLTEHNGKVVNYIFLSLYFFALSLSQRNHSNTA